MWIIQASERYLNLCQNQKELHTTETTLRCSGLLLATTMLLIIGNTLPSIMEADHESFRNSVKIHVCQDPAGRDGGNVRQVATIFGTDKSIREPPSIKFSSEPASILSIQQRMQYYRETKEEKLESVDANQVTGVR